MNRKKFLSSVIPLAASASTFADFTSVKKLHSSEHTMPETLVPPYLQPGDIVGITCPSGYITMQDVQPAINKMTEWGFRVQTGNTVGLRDFSFAGNDESRAKDFNEMINDDAIKAVMLGRGGYGAVRIIDQIDFKKFKKDPKWIIGFSDATVFHSHINSNFGIATIHSKMCNSFPADWSSAEPKQIASIESIQKCLKGTPMQYECNADSNNRNGIAEGRIIGGNLSILQNLSGTPSEINTDDAILFIEDTEEYSYSIDRMLWNLKRSGKLDNLKALIVGAFNKLKPDDPGDDFGKNIYDMVLEKVKEYAYPVCFNFPVGHQKENYALKCSVKHRLTINDKGVLLQEL